MRFSLRIFLGFFLLIAAGGWYGLTVLRDDLQPALRQSTEESLVETANTLAALLGEDMRAGRLDNQRLLQLGQDLAQRRPHAEIWGMYKNSVDLELTITDARGIVVANSNGKGVGEDHSQWRDVYLTLRGQYGSRTSRADPADAASTTMYVSAPIYAQPAASGASSPGPLLGVLTVAKPSNSLLPYLTRAERKMTRLGWATLAAGLLLGGLFSWWLSRGITQLTRYARATTQGQSLPVPPFPGNRELAELARALEQMRRQLDGKAYIEQHVQDMTHELKSPLSGILGSAELLDDPQLEADQRQRFLGHIRAEALRMRNIVDRLLDLARVEARQGIVRGPVDLAQLLQGLVEALTPQLGSRKLELFASPYSICGGEQFLLTQALRNLLQNALDFTPDGQAIAIHVQVGEDGMGWRVRIVNPGAAIPEYALPRLFERFYSLPGPHRQGKGSGLGLALARAVARLHGGDVTLRNRSDGFSGAEAELTLPWA
jgi:two-component system sensor histidine kinase CreC